MQNTFVPTAKPKPKPRTRRQRSHLSLEDLSATAESLRFNLSSPLTPQKPSRTHLPSSRIIVSLPPVLEPLIDCWTTTYIRHQPLNPDEWVTLWTHHVHTKDSPFLWEYYIGYTIVLMPDRCSDWARHHEVWSSLTPAQRLWLRAVATPVSPPMYRGLPVDDMECVLWLQQTKQHKNSTHFMVNDCYENEWFFGLVYCITHALTNRKTDIGLLCEKVLTRAKSKTDSATLTQTYMCYLCRWILEHLEQLT